MEVLGPALQQMGFDITTVEEFGAARRMAGIRTATQMVQFARARADAIDAWPTAPWADLGR
eukprot:1682180-Lingulodinium_polyedra.AAC.1